MKKLNRFFFEQEHITLSDFIWFYGAILAMILFTAGVLVPAWIQLFTI